MPKISIIVIIYKVERFLDKCLESIISQTYDNLEILLVVGKGDSECIRICNEYAAKDSRIIVIEDEPKGTAAARNSGLDRVGGDYIAFVDGDDYIAEDMIETMVNAALRHDADISVVGKYLTYENIIEGTDSKDNEEMVLSKRDAYEMILYGTGFFLHIWDKMYKKELFEGLRFTPGKKVEDRQMAQILISRANRTVYNTASKYYFRVSEDSGSRVEDNLQLSLEADRLIVSDMLKEFPQIKPASDFFMVNETMSVIQSSMLYGIFSKSHDKENLGYVRKHAGAVLKNGRVRRSLKIKTLMCAYAPNLFKKVTLKRRKQFLLGHKEYSTGTDWKKCFDEQKIEG